MPEPLNNDQKVRLMELAVANSSDYQAYYKKMVALITEKEEKTKED